MDGTDHLIAIGIAWAEVLVFGGLFAALMTRALRPDDARKEHRMNTTTAPRFVIFGREPAWWLALIAVTVSLVSAFLIDVTPEAQAAINAAAGALAGLITAVMVRDGKVLSALVGLVQALMVLAISWGFDLTAEKQALVLTAVTVLAQGYLRTQVTAPVPARDERERLPAAA